MVEKETLYWLYLWYRNDLKGKSIFSWGSYYSYPEPSHLNKVFDVEYHWLANE